jgi:hypothetical protein
LVRNATFGSANPDLPNLRSMQATDGTVAGGPYPESKAYIGGFSVVDVPSREEALKWAAKIAAACRCTQEVRAIGFDPELEAMLGKVAVDALKTRDRG